MSDKKEINDISYKIEYTEDKTVVGVHVISDTNKPMTSKQVLEELAYFVQNATETELDLFTGAAHDSFSSGCH